MKQTAPQRSPYHDLVSNWWIKRIHAKNIVKIYRLHMIWTGDILYPLPWRLLWSHQCFAKITAVKENQVVLLSGETGCGKSTQAPVGHRFGEGCPSGMMRWFKRFTPEHWQYWQDLTDLVRRLGSTCCWDSDWQSSLLSQIWLRTGYIVIISS